MLGKIKDALTGAVLGEVVKEWGVISDESGALFNEQLKLTLYAKDGRDVVCMAYDFGSANKQLLSFGVGDLRQFASTLQTRMAEVDRIAGHPGNVPTAGRNKLPFFPGLVAKVIHGVKASRLLVDEGDRSSGSPSIRMHAYVSRKNDVRVVLHINAGDNSSQLVSGAGIRAMAQVLADRVGLHAEAEEQSAAATHGAP